MRKSEFIISDLRLSIKQTITFNQNYAHSCAIGCRDVSRDTWIGAVLLREPETAVGIG
jgi:hypothetical protein